MEGQAAPGGGLPLEHVGLLDEVLHVARPPPALLAVVHQDDVVPAGKEPGERGHSHTTSALILGGGKH